MPKASLKTITTKEDLSELLVAAKKDHHSVVFPSHLVRKEEKTIGYAGIFSMPILMWWLDSKEGKARDSLELMTQIEDIARSKNVRRYATICSEDSPYYPHMARLGFQKLGPTVLFEKELS